MQQQFHAAHLLDCDEMGLLEVTLNAPEQTQLRIMMTMAEFGFDLCLQLFFGF